MRLQPALTGTKCGVAGLDLSGRAKVDGADAIYEEKNILPQPTLYLPMSLAVITRMMLIPVRYMPT